MALSETVEVVGKLLPVPLTARMALAGVILMTVAGGTGHYRVMLTQARLEVKVEAIESAHSELKTDLLRSQSELKEDVKEQLEKMDKKLDLLLARRP